MLIRPEIQKIQQQSCVLQKYKKFNNKVQKIQQQQKIQQRSNTPEPKTPRKEKKNRKLTEKILPQDQQQKSKHRELSRLRSQPRKNYKTFIPHSKTLKKVKFQK